MFHHEGWDVAERPHVTEWVNGRAACVACSFVGWLIKHPEAEVACPTCGAPTRPASGDERCLSPGAHISPRISRSGDSP